MVQRFDVSIPSVLSATIDVVSHVGSIEHIAKMGTVSRINDVRQTTRPDYLLNLPAGVDKNSIMRSLRVDTVGRINVTGSVDISKGSVGIKSGSVGIKGQPIQVSQTNPLNMYVLVNGVTPGMSTAFLRCDSGGNLYISAGSVGIKSLPSISGTVEIKGGIIGTVYVGTVAIGAIAGSVHIQGTINNINYLGSVGHIVSGSVGVLGGSIGIKSGSVGVSHLPPVTGSVDIRTGSIGWIDYISEVATVTDVTTVATVSAVDSVTEVIEMLSLKSGSVGLLGGSIGIKSGSVGLLGGSVGIKNGSIGISGQPIDIHGSVDNVRSATGTCGLVSIVGSAELLLNANSSRLGAFVQNIGSTAGTGSVYIGFDHTVAATKMGARLKDSDSYSTTIYTGSIWGYGVGSIDIAVHEY